MARTFAAIVGLVLGVAAGLSLPACRPTLTAQDARELDEFQTGLARCRAEGRDAGSYAAYEACKRDGGLTAGGGR